MSVYRMRLKELVIEQDGKEVMSVKNFSMEMEYNSPSVSSTSSYSDEDWDEEEEDGNDDFLVMFTSILLETTKAEDYPNEWKTARKPFRVRIEKGTGVWLSYTDHNEFTCGPEVWNCMLQPEGYQYGGIVWRVSPGDLSWEEVAAIYAAPVRK